MTRYVVAGSRSQALYLTYKKNSVSVSRGQLKNLLCSVGLKDETCKTLWGDQKVYKVSVNRIMKKLK